MTRPDAAELRRAREAALHMLYQWEVGRMSAHESVVTYWPARDETEQLPEALQLFANNLAKGTIERVQEIDALIAAHAQNWRVERMAALDRLVLRLATYELLSAPETPGKVVINEALELARMYSGDESVGCPVARNGLLDRERRPRRGAKDLEP